MQNIVVNKSEHSLHSSIEPPPPPLSTQVDTDVLHMIKYTRPPPSVFAYCKHLRTGWWEGLGTKLTFAITLACETCTTVQKLATYNRHEANKNEVICMLTDLKGTLVGVVEEGLEVLL